MAKQPEKAKESVRIIDQETAFLYPEIDPEQEVRMITQKDEIVPQSAERVRYFSFNFRLRDAALNAIARKYCTKLEEGDDEICLLGPQTVQEAWPDPRLERVQKVIAKHSDLRKTDIIGLYLPEVDINDAENRQQFLAMGKERFYARYDDLELKAWEYEDLLFTADGIIDRYHSPNAKEYVEYAVSAILRDDFLAYAQEVTLLHIAKLSGIRARHTAADSEPRLTQGHRKDYLKFLVQVGASNGHLTARQLLHLEIIAREFMIAAEDLEEYLRESIKKKLTENAWHIALKNFTSQCLQLEQRYVFYQDVLEMAVNDTGGINCPVVLKFLARDAFAGSDFVENYLTYLSNERQAQQNLLKAMLAMKNLQINGQNFYTCQMHNNDLALYLLEMGVEVNGFK